MADEARHQARREQLEILAHALISDPPQEGEAPLELTTVHVIVMMMSMAYALDQLEGGAQDRLVRARARSMRLLQEGGETPEIAGAMLDQAILSLHEQAAGTGLTEQADPAVCKAWLRLLEEELDYVSDMLRE